MAKKFKVLSLTLGGLSNKVFNAGDEVGEECFPAENIKGLVDQGFLEEIKAEKKAEKKAEEEGAKK